MVAKKQSDIIIFTDGSSRGNPGPGGYGAVIVNTKLSEVIELGGSKGSTTNNEMELAAAIAALSYISHTNSPAAIYTDSRYVIQGITGWVYGWMKNGWQTAAKEDVKNKRQWQQLVDLVKDREGLRWVHVHGHVGVPGNERADEIATMYADGDFPGLFRGNLADYDNASIAEIDQAALDAAAEKARSKPKKNTGPAYSYVSLVDGEIKTHKTWDECRERVHGKNAKFKKALSAEHEQEIISEWS